MSESFSRNVADRMRCDWRFAVVTHLTVNNCLLTTLETLEISEFCSYGKFMKNSGNLKFTSRENDVATSMLLQYSNMLFHNFWKATLLLYDMRRTVYWTSS